MAIKRDEHCPHFKDCTMPVTMYHFRTFCNGQHYARCFQHARLEDDLYMPTEWLSKLAMAERVK